MNAVSHITPKIDPQAAARAIRAALELVSTGGQPGELTPTDLSLNLADELRPILEPGEKLVLAGASMMALSAAAAEELCEATLHDLRAGPPIPPLFGVRDGARDWAAFATFGELRAYLGAIWNRLPDAERTSFIAAVRPKRRAA